MQTIYLDISNKGVVPCIHAKQGEVGRKFLAIITDNGVPYKIPDESLLSVWYEGDADAGNYSSINEKSAFIVDGNKVTVELVAQMLFKPGRGELCLSITHGNGGETNTWNIPYEVEYKPGAGSAVPTEYYTALTEAGSYAAEQAGIAKSAAESAEFYQTHARQSAEEAADAANSKFLEFANLLFPVGYIFYWEPVAGSEVDLSTPAKVEQYFGFGEWEQIKDTFLLACGDVRGVGVSGGSETHTLTIDEMPSHTHQLLGLANRESSTTWDGAVGTGNAKTEISVGTSGGNQPFEIMPPYRTVYVWKRFA